MLKIIYNLNLNQKSVGKTHICAVYREFTIIGGLCK